MRTGGTILRRLLLSSPVIVVVLVGAVLLWRYDAAARGDRDSIARTETVLLAIQSVQVQEEEAEAAERGYVLNGDAAFLVALNSAIEGLPGNAARVRRLVGGDPEQATRAATLEALVARRTEQMLHAVEMRRNLGPRAARAHVLLPDVRNTDRRVRETLAEIAAHERALLTRHRNAVRATERSFLLIGGLTGALAVGAQAVLWVLRRRIVTPQPTVA